MRSWVGRRPKSKKKDARVVELGEYLCEVRPKQYWRLEKLKSFDEFLEKRFPESGRRAYYLMAVHEIPDRTHHGVAATNDSSASSRRCRPCRVQCVDWRQNFRHLKADAAVRGRERRRGRKRGHNL